MAYGSSQILVMHVMKTSKSVKALSLTDIPKSLVDSFKFFFNFIGKFSYLQDLRENAK